MADPTSVSLFNGTQRMTMLLKMLVTDTASPFRIERHLYCQQLYGVAQTIQ